MSKRERDGLLERTRSREIDLLFATKCITEGHDFPFMSRLYLTTPKRAAADVERLVGRIMRVSSGKTEAVVFDYVDDRPFGCKPHVFTLGLSRNFASQSKGLLSNRVRERNRRLSRKTPTFRHGV